MQFHSQIVVLVLVISATIYGADYVVQQVVNDQVFSKGRWTANTALTELHWPNRVEALDSSDETLSDRFSGSDLNWQLVPIDTGNDEEHAVVEHFKSQPYIPELSEQSDFTVSYVIPPSRDDSAYRYYQPIRAAQSCLSCHGVDASADDCDARSFSPGEVAAVIRVDIPSASMLRTSHSARSILIGEGIVILALGALATTLIARRTLVSASA